MMASAFIESKQVAESIEMSPIHFGEHLRKPKDEFPSAKSIMDDFYFTQEEFIETIESLVRDHQVTYNNLCRNYLQWKEQSIFCHT